MRFQIGDIVRVSSDHEDKHYYNYDMRVIEVTPHEGLTVHTERLDGSDRDMGWFEESLKLVRRGT